MEKTSVQAEIASYIGKLLRDHFGKGPSSVYVSINHPYVTMHMRDFLAPMERVLMSQEKPMKVEEIRDYLMHEMIPEMKTTLKAHLGIGVKEIYYDWSLENRSGMLLCILETQDELHELKEYPEKAAIHAEISHVSKLAEKTPELLDSCYLNDRTLIIKREGILVRIEKELIKNGFEEVLKLSKRRLEKSLLRSSNIKNILQVGIADIFVDWDFQLDTSYIVFVLLPSK